MSEGTSPGATATAPTATPAAGAAPASANVGAGDGPAPTLDQVTVEPAGAGHVNITGQPQAGQAGVQQGREQVTATSRDSKSTGTDAQAAPPADAQANGGKGWKVEDLPAEAQKLIGDLRKENAATRKTNQESAGKVTDLETKLNGLVEGLARVLGGGSPEGAPAAPPDPEKLTAQLDEMTGNHRDATVRLAVYEKAHEYGANVPELMDSAAFLADLKRLDPAGQDFASDLGKVIEAAVERNPARFKVQPAQAAAAPPIPSGGEFTGGPGGSPTTDLESMDVDGFRELRKKTRPL